MKPAEQDGFEFYYIVVETAEPLVGVSKIITFFERLRY